MKNLKEVTERLAVLGKQVSQIYEEAGEDLDFSKVKCLEGDTTAKVEALKNIDTEVTELSAERTKLLDIERSLKAGRDLNTEMNEPAEGMKHPTPGDPKAEIKSLGELFVESKAYKEKGKGALVDIDTKTLMSEGTAGWPTLAPRLPRVELTAQRELVVADVFPIIPTIQNSIKYMYESAYASNAAEVKEAYQGTVPTFGEAQLALTETSEPVQKIAVFLPVSDEQLEDVAGIQAYINSRMTYMIQARLDGQLITGDASDPNLRGVLNAGSIQTQTRSTDPDCDAIFKALTKVRTVGFTEPGVIIMHPNNWQTIRLVTTADGIYIFGSPMEAGEPKLWGKPIVITAAITENTAVVGNFRVFSALYMKRGLEFKVTDSHASYFTGGVQVIRCDMRCAAVYFRGLAFCKVTGLNP